MLNLVLAFPPLIKFIFLYFILAPFQAIQNAGDKGVDTTDDGPGLLPSTVMRRPVRKTRKRTQDQFLILARSKNVSNEEFAKEAALVQTAVGKAKNVTEWRKEKRTKSSIRYNFPPEEN